MRTTTPKKTLSIRLPEPLLAELGTLAARFNVSREEAIRLVLTAANDAQLIKGFEILGGRAPSKD